MDFSNHVVIFLAPLLIAPLFFSTLYLSTLCPLRPHCFLLTTTASSQTMYCESTLLCTIYRMLLFASFTVVVMSLIGGLAWCVIRATEDEDVSEKEWDEELGEEDTDCEDEYERYRD
jgi:hypothetical protein